VIFQRTVACLLEDVRSGEFGKTAPITEYVATMGRVQCFIGLNRYDFAQLLLLCVVRVSVACKAMSADGAYQSPPYEYIYIEVRV
jgi:hypothetical protein